jgi:hypothetical protein
MVGDLPQGAIRHERFPKGASLLHLPSNYVEVRFFVFAKLAAQHGHVPANSGQQRQFQTEEYYSSWMAFWPSRSWKTILSIQPESHSSSGTVISLPIKRKLCNEQLIVFIYDFEEGCLQCGAIFTTLLDEWIISFHWGLLLKLSMKNSSVIFTLKWFALAHSMTFVAILRSHPSRFRGSETSISDISKSLFSSSWKRTKARP